MTTKSFKIISRVLETKREALENQFPDETRTETQQVCITDLQDCERELAELYNASKLEHA